jgi:GT2 family glycosyltransferase
MSTADPSVLAIVLSYAAPEAVERCVSYLRRQTFPVSEILIVDNDSPVPPDDAALLHTGGTPIRLMRLPENLGPAGGYAIGLSAFLESRYDYAWLMDDDCMPATGCLEALVCEVLCRDEDVYVQPAMFNASTGAREDHWGFDGVLIPRRAVELGGLPDERFFICYEDTEYLRDRLPNVGYGGVRTEDAVIAAALRPADVKSPSWKYYYHARNHFYFYMYMRRQLSLRTRLKIELYEEWKQVRRVLRVEADPATKLAHHFRGVFDGLRGRLGRTIVPEHPDRPWALQTPRPHPRRTLGARNGATHNLR